MRHPTGSGSIAEARSFDLAFLRVGSATDALGRSLVFLRSELAG